MYEVLAEVIAVASILIKFGYDEILENKVLFVAFLNELKIKSHTGAPITVHTLTTMSENITTREQRQLIDEFNIGHEPLYRRLEMCLNTSKTI
ncbi:anti-sigma factor [Acinetobacter phage 133]|uniref:AsiA anti-sigma 70 protein n=1 Tax=Acinetobacter phage 133 TaxID=2919552 RepID=D9I6I4_9CAUD|nr:anti-sigma factor [Acinetobacter phage 133]ADJ19565.1 AsiA anti-sigma 70 protein [Acinetobacter phage 133]